MYIRHHLENDFFSVSVSHKFLKFVCDPRWVGWSYRVVIMWPLSMGSYCSFTTLNHFDKSTHHRHWATNRHISTLNEQKKRLYQDERGAKSSHRFARVQVFCSCSLSQKYILCVMFILRHMQWLLFSKQQRERKSVSAQQNENAIMWWKIVLFIYLSLKQSALFEFAMWLEIWCADVYFITIIEFIPVKWFKFFFASHRNK